MSTAYAEKIVSFEPLEDWVLIEPWQPNIRRPDAIILPDGTHVGKSGVVVAVGPGKYATETGRLIPMQIETGARVWFGDIQCAKVTVGGRELYMCRQAYIYGVITTEEE